MSKAVFWGCIAVVAGWAFTFAAFTSGCTAAERQQALDVSRGICTVVEHYDPDAGITLRFNVPKGYFSRDGGAE